MSFVLIVISSLLFVTGCGGGSTEDIAGEDYVREDTEQSEASNGGFTDKDDFIKKNIYGFPEFGELLQLFDSITYTINGHESNIVFKGEEEVNGVMTSHYHLDIVDKDGRDNEYDVWIDEAGFPIDGVEVGEEDEEFYDLAVDHWIGDALAPFYDFNYEFRYNIDYTNDYSIESHETHNDTLLQFDVLVHTIKGIDSTYVDEIDYKVVVADAGQFEVILERIFDNDPDREVIYELKEVVLR